ncbi:SDR family NAD(P)-dependent oxidoreductase [Nocardioides daejeonensis]|uniref:SDR family NAD(P)-dependent oxidoreductase n=1 Tax=Nocardioides daejeonensis TaxID=1046556 RepID=UPI001EF714AE|nr:SDR family NAD(P)-dependent oxidoreductase [Nocardioides daejeonensis]
MSSLDPALVRLLDGVDLTGRTVVVTGATTGMGLETAYALAAAGASTVLAGRDAERLSAARARVAEVATALVHTVELDLADLVSVGRGAVELAGLVERIDVLINNAGVMFTPLLRTAQGHELQFGTNHLGHFALTTALRPLLGDGSRIVNLSSAGHRLGEVELGDVDWRRRDYDKFAAYGAAKSANILFTVEADRRWRAAGVRSFAVHPGTVATDLARHMDRDDFKEMVRLASSASTAPSGSSSVSVEEPPRRMTFATPAQGAATSVWAATTPELDGRGGLYLADCAVSSDVRPSATDPERATALWALSEELVSAASSASTDGR